MMTMMTVMTMMTMTMTIMTIMTMTMMMMTMSLQWAYILGGHVSRSKSIRDITTDPSLTHAGGLRLHLHLFRRQHGRLPNTKRLLLGMTAPKKKPAQKTRLGFFGLGKDPNRWFYWNYWNNEMRFKKKRVGKWCLVIFLKNGLQAYVFFWNQRKWLQILKYH